MKKIIYILGAVIVLIGIILGIRFFIGGNEDTWLCENGQWIKHGNPSETKPTSDCSVPINKAKIDDLIILDYPLSEATVSSPLEITGQARGNWFFEANFPVILTDWDGRIIAQGVAQAQENWMTTAFVPFKATLNFIVDTTVSNRGALILKKDNPSGLPENDNALEITVFFSEQTKQDYQSYQAELKSNASTDIKNLFVTKYNKKTSEVVVDIKMFNPDFAFGQVNFLINNVQGEGGIFFAYRQAFDGEWRLAFDGNGAVDCTDLRTKSFPEEMLTSACDPLK